jgi:hypothetical protein
MDSWGQGRAQSGLPKEIGRGVAHQRNGRVSDPPTREAGWGCMARATIVGGGKSAGWPVGGGRAWGSDEGINQGKSS